MIAILDYGLGNINAFVNLFTRQNRAIIIAKTVDDLKGVTHLLLPGVGAFDYAMQRFNESGLRQHVEKLVFDEAVPIMGICVGMQMLAHGSEEGKLPGLGWINGTVRKFDPSTIPYHTRLPHMGWNTIEHNHNHSLFNDLGSSARFYFLHSYYFDAENTENVLSKTEYGIKFSSAVIKHNIVGIQFHPEKSHSNGEKLLLNFERWNPC